MPVYIFIIFFSISRANIFNTVVLIYKKILIFLVHAIIFIFSDYFNNLLKILEFLLEYILLIVQD